MDTNYAPAKRTERRALTKQIESISKNPIMDTLMEVTAGVLIVLNEDRQIVGLNEKFLRAIGIDDPSIVLGLRLGETLNCVYSSDPPHGCGTTPHCITCGAAIATMVALETNEVSERAAIPADPVTAQIH